MTGLLTRPSQLPDDRSAAADERAAWAARDSELRLLRRADPHAALAAARQWLAEVAPGSEAEAWALRTCAHGLNESGTSPEEAVGIYERVEQAFERLGQPLEVARTAPGHIWTLRNLGRYDEAIRIARRSRRFLLANDASLDAAKITLNLGAVFRRQGSLPTARRAYLDAARDARRCGDGSLEVTAISNLGNVLADLGHFGEAELIQRRAIRLYTQLNLPAQVARARLNLGLLLKRRGDYGRAVTALRESRASFAALGVDDGVALVDLDLGQTYVALNLQREAAEAIERARAGFARLEMPFELGQALVWSAAVAGRRGERALAAEHLAEAAARFRQIGNPLWESVATALAAGLGQVDEPSLAAVTGAERRLVRLRARDRAIEARLVRGDLLRSLGRERPALACYRSAERAARALGDELLSYRARAALGSTLMGHRPGRALGHFRAAIEHLETLRRRARADDLKLSFVADKLDVFEQTVGLLLRRGHGERTLAEALATVERGKSLGLLDDLLAAADRGGRESVARARRLRDLRAQLSEAYAHRDERRGQADAAERARLNDLEQQVAAATRELQLGRGGETVVAPFDLDRLRAALPADSLLLEYYSYGGELVCFMVARDRLRLRQGLGCPAEVAHLAERLRFHLNRGIFGAKYLESHDARLRHDLDRVLGRVWQQLLAPLRSDLRAARRLIVVPHGPLHGLPLHAAHDGRAYLADRWEVSYAPSARVFTACAEREAGPPRRPLFVGPAIEQLPWVSHEVASLAQLFPDGEELIGRRATLAGLRRRAGHFDLLHLAAHGQFRADNPSFSALRLSDGWLSVADLAELSRGATLVTLSACETGLNSVTAGDELIGLTRAVLGAGAASLLASLWTVHDESTSLLMAEFYRGLRDGLGKVASLQRAMRRLRHERDNPYFWAPFALAGAV